MWWCIHFTTFWEGPVVLRSTLQNGAHRVQMDRHGNLEDEIETDSPIVDFSSQICRFPLRCRCGPQSLAADCELFFSTSTIYKRSVNGYITQYAKLIVSSTPFSMLVVLAQRTPHVAFQHSHSKSYGKVGLHHAASMVI